MDLDELKRAFSADGFLRLRGAELAYTRSLVCRQQIAIDLSDWTPETPTWGERLGQSRRSGQGDERTDRLPTEPRDSIEMAEVRHWRRVYEELVSGYRTITGTTGTDYRVVSGTSADRESGSIQLLRNAERRLQFWDRRYRELLGQ